MENTESLSDKTPTPAAPNENGRFPLNSADPNAARIAALRQLFPDAFTEGKLDAERLKAALGEANVADAKERYELTWAGKGDARRALQSLSAGTMTPERAQSVKFDSTENVIIEGDNLEVLKLLQRAYQNKIKCIYIDPPYNTGKEFIYPDRFQEGLEDYLRFSGQVGEGGERLSANVDTDGRYHSKWLSMMYPRLFLARNLLTNDGVIFVSIDDNEVHNLRAMMNEIFGEENFVASIVWQKRTSPDSRATVGAAHDYILMFARRIEIIKERGIFLPITEAQKASFKNPDNDPKGTWTSVDITAQAGHATKSQFYEIVTPAGVIYLPPQGRCWGMAERTFKQLVQDNKIWFGKDDKARPRLKQYLSEADGIAVWTWWGNLEVGHNQEAKQEVNELFLASDIFDTPKPTRLISRMVRICSHNANDIILDFFAGSGATADALLN